MIKLAIKCSKSFLMLWIVCFSLFVLFLRCNYGAFKHESLPERIESPGRRKLKTFREDICSKDNEVRKFTDGTEFKKILMWTSFNRGKKLWGKVFERHCLSECEENRCHFTTDKTTLNDSSAIIFDGVALKLPYLPPWEADKDNFPPPPRNPDQIYIYFNLEPPTRYTDVMLHVYNNFFNWTMSYRKDSDIFVPYGRVYKRSKKRPVNEIPYVTQEELNKKKMAIWLNSNCEVSHSSRESFAKQLQKYIQVDRFGMCHHRPCGKRAIYQNAKNVGEDECEKSFSNYNFYLALENSLCKDYVTEKLFRSLKLGIIPVVLGAVNYTSVAPPNSFIDYKDFGSISAMAEHMKKVASNADHYNGYFKWHEDYEVEVGGPYKAMICDLCKQLHYRSRENRFPTKTYIDIRKWFIEDSNCYTQSYPN